MGASKQAIRRGFTIQRAGLAIDVPSQRIEKLIHHFEDGTNVEQCGSVTTTRFPCGAECSNWPPGTQEYVDTAAWLGFTDLAAYNFEHELCHILVPLVLFGERGYVSWMSAQGKRMSLAAAKAEERLIWMVQAAAAGKIDVPHGCEGAVEALKGVQRGLAG